ncbi:Abscisic acid G-protein coupled receptor-domain-containing protein [Boeremia exigua]|uniref:Abscisic acid G-protein coupled receptor-domain-containing protein n=1 Tax=Boeremia exigua TaxID=749465 RepID=UPI001E8E9B4A|nr:Abscisic acid G-protein coupled receptor-domain-containing protein [Boeremia exigua]KAH6616287.1 Abscisic acid G-protein coupled receptor-domain-containing protein [Boeremia exigua]
MISLEDDCNECVPEYLVQRGPVKTIISALPFLLTFLVVALGVSPKLFPVLSNQPDRKAHHSDARLPGSPPRERASLLKSLRLDARALAAVIFSTNIALSAVLAELIFCEITSTGNRSTRTLALKFTLPSLLFLLVVATPALVIHSVVSGAGWSTGGAQSGQRKVAWILEFCGLAIWLAGFWYLGSGLLGTYLHEESYVHDHTFSEGCLERIGVIGISMMASLTGFAAVSSLWQTFGVRYRPVSEADIARKEAGIQATNDMLLAKGSRLRAVERKLSDHPQEGLMGRVVGTFRGNPDVQERNMLRLEIQGLETMRHTLQSSSSILHNRRQTQLRAHTAHGRLLNAFSFVFALYCAYRILATSVTTLRRFSAPSTSFAASDPINTSLALLAKHWDPSLDRAAWSRSISFLLSGVILLLSFNAVLQTFYLFSRAAPGVLHHAQANFALLISQIAATYVISSALLLRSNLPVEMKSAVSDALGAPLEPRFTERWFEGWFLAASAATAVGLWAGKRIRGAEWDEDGEGGADVELGKRC